ncbi:MAG: hypothetical protein SNF33_03385 [Candidatus Algichlamydia australiensis]|nr:hypothetical protein [Chlamydiales bacterium]
MDIIFSTMGKNEVQQMQTMNLGSHQLGNQNKNLTVVSEKLGGLDTDTSGGKGGLIAGIAAAVAIAGVGLALSFVLGPEMEVAAGALDTLLFGADIAGEAGTEMVDFAATEAAEEVVESVAKDGVKTTTRTFKDADGAVTREVTTKTEKKKNGSIVNTHMVEEGSKKTRYTETVSPNGDREITKKNVLFSTPFGDIGTPSGKLNKKILLGSAPIAISGGIGVGTMAASTISSTKSARFNQQYGFLNNLAQIINNTIGQINSQLISAPNQIIQGDQQVISTALQAAAQLYTIPPVQ